MKHKFLLSIALLVLLFATGSCRMHTVQGTPYSVWHITGRTHHHWGAPHHSTYRGRFWGGHRYGPRPNRHRGHFRY